LPQKPEPVTIKPVSLMKLDLLAVISAATLLLVLTSNETTRAQGTAFSYQGKLSDHGTPGAGSYDFTFALFDDAIAGNSTGITLTNSAVQVVGGAFSVVLDFGATFPGADRWIEIGVRTNGNAAFTTLTPRQKITSTPYAVTAANLNSTAMLAPTQLGRLTNHIDVSSAGLAAGQVLVYNGTFWTNVFTTSSGNNATNVPPVLLSYSGTNVPVNAGAGTHFRLVATNNFLLQNPTGAADGQRLVFELIQDSLGGRTMAFGNAFKLGTDLPVINLTTNANGRDFMSCIASGTNFFVVGFIKGF